MKPSILALLLGTLLLCSCVDADDGGPTVAVNESANRPAYLTGTAAYDPEQVAKIAAAPDSTRTVSYLSEKPWDGWETSPQRVKVTVRADNRRHTHYFESLPVAYGWLPERYGEFDIVELLVANALTGRDLLDFNSAYFLTTRDYRGGLPMVLAYPSRHQTRVYVDRYPERYTVVERVELDRSLDDWRARHWGDWRDDFGFVRTASVAHIDGEFWDGWYETPDRVLVRLSERGNLASYYFDSLPVAWSWLDRRPSGYELVDLQVGAADGSLRLLPAREASYVFLPAEEDALPAMLAFATASAARSYLDRLGSDDFRVVDWDGLKPHLKTWSDYRWDDWRGNPRRERGIARALESGLGRKLGLRGKDDQGVVAGDRRVRERLNNDGKHAKSAAKAGKRANKAARKAAQSGAKTKPGKASSSGKSKAKKRSGKAKGDHKSKPSKAKQRTKSTGHSSKSEARDGQSKSKSHGSAKRSGRSHQDANGKAKGRGGGKGKK